MSSTDISPFVEAHRIGRLEFNISSPVKPISIRDQMVRAEMLIDGLIDAGIISSEKPLLIVGGGAAAATAALAAAETEFVGGPPIRVVLVNKATGFFTLQAKCATRWIDPTQYDWPAAHWTEAKYPWHDPSATAPLPWNADTASAIAGDWSTAMQEADDALPNLEIRHEHELVDLPVYHKDEKRLECTIRKVLTDIEIAETFGCVIYAVGFGAEKNKAGDFYSRHFWQSDTLETDHAGWNTGSISPVLVAICGAGDGALQDFIRVVTGMRSAGDLMKIVADHLDPEQEVLIQSEEEQADRALLWTHNKEDEHRICLRLHGVFQDVVENLASDPVVITKLSGLLNARLTGLTVRLFHPCDHFSPGYALNRFLVLLLCKWAEITKAPIGRVPRRMLDKVEGLTHTCKKDAEACEGKLHRITFTTDATCQETSGIAELTNANLVILRTGLEHLEFLPLSKRKTPFSRQILPYFPPQQYS